MVAQEAGEEVGKPAGDVKPNAQATFEMGKKREPVTFEMFKPKLKSKSKTKFQDSRN